MAVSKTGMQQILGDTRSAEGNKVWSIVLAGGSGQRMQSFVRTWLENERPKQYCNFAGRRSMFEHTLERAMALSRQQIVTVIAKGHEQYIEDYNIPGAIVSQPRACGTAPGVFLPLSVIMSQDPEAIVHILPSDHFIYSKKAFVKQMRCAENLVKRVANKLVLCAATADYAEKEYGWIEPGSRINGTEGRNISSFREKPNARDAEEFLQHGYMWNTMIMTVKAKTLWQIGWKLYPCMMALYENLTTNKSDGQYPLLDEAELDGIYRKMPEIDFSKGIVEKITDSTLLLPLKDIMWSDWGRPERILYCLQTIGSRPTFPVGLVPVSEYTPEPAFSASF